MNLRKEIFIALACFIVFGALVFVPDFARAQQLPTKNPVTQNTTSPSPTPPVSTAPSASPTPEIVEEDDEVVKIDTDLVNVLFTAQDKDRRLISNLKKEDIRVLEDGKPQEIFHFERQVGLPMSIAILLDASESQRRTLPEEKVAAKAFVESVVRPAKDEVAILTFTGETTLEQGLTGNIARIRRGLDRVEFIPATGVVNGVLVGTPPISGTNRDLQASTAIWDAIWITSDEVLRMTPENTRRVIILVSDGVNTSGLKKFDEAVEAAIKQEAIIYCVGVGDDYYNGVNRGALRKISERTGGKAFFPESDSDLRRAFVQIEMEMRTQYLVSYQPSNLKRDGSFRKIEIQLVNPELTRQKTKLTHREGYFATSEPNTPARKK